jgi:class 3 adenylate cyclase
MADSETEAPAIRRTATEWLALARRQESEGELFEAYDLAMQGLAQYPDDWRLKHRAVLCLASTGATHRARELSARLGLADPDPKQLAGLDPRLALDIQALGPRLDRDVALAARGSARRPLLLKAAAGYEAIYRQYLRTGLPDAYYPGICCANLRLLGGEPEAAEKLARELLNRLAAWPTAKSYYEIATELEAQLILGDIPRAGKTAELLRATVATDPDYRSIARTIQQLRLVADARRLDLDPSESLALPRVIHYLGHIISAPGVPGRFVAEAEETVRNQIETHLARSDTLFAYGSLAAGADILFAEAVLRKPGGSLHVVLPFALDEFIRVSVQPAGEHWVDRFLACYEKASSRRFATEDGYLGDDALFSYCSQLAMGLARLRAGLLSSQAEQIAVWDGQPARGVAGTAVDVTVWARSGLPQTVIRIDGRDAPGTGSPPMQGNATRRRTRAMLFGDIKGFSKLTDTQLPPFVEHVLGAIGRVVDRFDADILLKNTWGDGLFLVFDDAGKAADCALALQEELAAVDLKKHGLPETLALRLGGHLGPVYQARDPILHRENFFGAHVSRAARIEPITPEKLVYVTETLAAVLALHNADAFTCHYVGMTRAAKDYGTMRMFVLTRNGG